MSVLGHSFVNFTLDRDYSRFLSDYVREHDIRNNCGRHLSLAQICHSIVVSWCENETQQRSESELSKEQEERNSVKVPSSSQRIKNDQ